jgi:hypothetical protein
MNFRTHFSILSTALAVIFFSSCGKTDTELPTVCTEPGSTNSVLADEIEGMAGTSIDITDTFCDNEALSEVRWDIHNAADHAHEENESDEGFVLHSGTEWELLQVNALSGTSTANTITLDIPLTARGVWDIVAAVVDEDGNATIAAVTQMHVENDYIPEFTLSSVDGVDPSTWPGEPTWNAGSIIACAGMVMDSDGVSEAHLSLVRESDETVIWDLHLQPEGAEEFAFEADVTLPADASSGEYHFEMTATDGTANEMETGFHLEVE